LPITARTLILSPAAKEILTALVPVVLPVATVQVTLCAAPFLKTVNTTVVAAVGALLV
jgi:hypothetical protein